MGSVATTYRKKIYDEFFHQSGSSLISCWSVGERMENPLGNTWGTSGRKNVLRKLLRVPYRRFKAGFSVRWLCLFVAGVLSEVHEVRTFARCKAFLFDVFAFFSSLENYFGFTTTNVKGKTDNSVSLRRNKRLFLKRRVCFLIVHPINLSVDFAGLNSNPLVFCY